MPNDVKVWVSVITLLVAAAVAYWEYGLGRTDLTWIVAGTGLFMVIAMWVFPEAGVKKGKREP